MNCLDGVLENLDTANFDSIENRMKPCNELWRGINNFLNNVKRAVEIYQRTGVAPQCNFESWETFEVVEDSSQHSSKENVAPNEDASSKNPTGRRRRNTARETALKNIKKEKMSLLSPENDEMPAPTQPALRKTKRKGSRVCIKEEKLEEILEQDSTSQDSVIIQDVPVPVVDLLDSDDNEQAFKNEETEGTPPRTRKSSRKTRQKTTENITFNLIESNNEEEAVNLKTETRKTKQNPHNKVKIEKSEEEPPKQASQDMTMVMVNLIDSIATEEKATKNKTKYKEVKKRARSNSLSDSDEQNTEKRTKSDSDNPPIEDAINNATFVSKIPLNGNLNTVLSAMNSTVVVENPKFKNNSKLLASADLMAKDEKKSATKVVPKTVTKVPRANNTKLEGSGAKQKIPSSLEPSIAIETKTRGQAKEQEVSKIPEICTPPVSKHLPRSVTATAKKIAQTPQSSLSSRLVTAKFASELKASQLEYREREKKRRQKEKEDLVSIKAQLDARKKKLDEKKAKQQREACEKDKQRQKEELVKKKLKAQEVHKRQEKPKREKEPKLPIYMITNPPLLPTEDCYDSDDERRTQRPYKEVSWAKSGNLNVTQYCLLAAGETIKNTFFSRQVETPDLQEIFEYIEPEKLKRSSSAIWHKPPRFTMMPVLDQHLEDSEEDEF